jgi:CobQ-like glutamine amidotransferase family enzyme
MNLYGDYGNVVMLQKRLGELGMDVSVDSRSAGDVLFDGTAYDFIYCGAGTEKKRDKALGLLMAGRDSLKEAIESGAHVLFTGNSWEMLGKAIHTVDGEDAEGLGIFDYVTSEVDTRVTHDIVAETELLERPVVGFVNKCGSVTDVKTPLFTKLMLGPGNSEGAGCEGFRYKNFCGTELIGPLLVKNPHMMDMYLKELCGKKYKKTDHESAEKAYEVTLRALLERV